ncbi:transglutaminase domain-containing protein [Nocardioides zhouii]|uniref:Transglutaminase domain-containing protein n=1 Tax=Nocardioides zhouii TaxID=1168729 RepID=A0A4Q2T279_9ACTN|nr:transglutaminase domain-containing protein [Nocardioides zhouii]RYC10858.1 hypothetical protein EUA94_11675 [Nocardioides zhouii]
MRARQASVDALAVVVLMGIILSIFDDTFADRSYLVAGMTPVVLLVLMALWASRLHEGGWVYTLGCLLIFAPLGSLAALHEPGPYGLPTVRTMTRLLASTVDAPVTLVSTVPPVEPSGTVLLVPFLIGFLATMPAAWLAFTTSRPLAPAMPLVLALAATIPLGVLEPTLLVQRGVVVGLLVIAWMVVRDRRRETSTGPARGAAGPVLTAVVTVALMSGVVGVLVPDGNQSDRVLLRGRTEPLPTLGAGMPRVTDGETREDVRLLRATGVPDGARLRFAALDLYDGSGWVPAEESPGSGGYGTYKRIGEDVRPLHTGGTTVVEVRILPGYDSDWLPMLGELTRIDLKFNPGRTEVSAVRYNQATSSALVIGGVDVEDEYSFESVTGQETFSRRDRTREPTDEQRQPSGAFLDPYLEPFDRDELLPLERVLLLARYLRSNGTVRLADGFDQSPEVLGRRMLGARGMVATQFQYSALMALASSRLGVAARVVTGAEPGPRGLVDYGSVTTWVELQFADGTWRPLDPSRYVGSRIAAEGEPAALPEPGDFVADQLARATRGKDREIRPPDGSTNPDGSPTVQQSPLRTALVAVAWVAGLVLVAFLLVPLLKRVRRWRRRRTPSWSGIYVNAWQEVLDAARDRGTPVPDGWSRVAQASALAAGVDLARRADAAVFAPGPSADASDGPAFWDDCLDLRRALLQDADRRHRWWAPFSPASLLAGWARARHGSGVAQVSHEDRRAGSQQPARA